MKTITEKMDDLLNQIIYLDLRTEVDTDKAKKAIRLSLKKQDRDTRHACAEAVLKCNEDVSGECIWKNDTHNACMNTKGF